MNKFYYAVFIVCFILCSDIFGAGVGEYNARYDTVELEDTVRKINGRVEELEKTVSEMLKDIVFLKEAMTKIIEGEKSSVSVKEPDPNEGKSSEEVIKIACDLIEDNNMEEARKLLGAYIKNNPEDVHCGMMHFYIGDSYFKEKNYKDAGLEYVNSYKINPNGSKSAEALYKLALCFKWLSKKADAILTLDKLICNYPNSNVIAKAKKERASLE